jgi:hypothetical protein
LRRYGAVRQGATEEEALNNIPEVVQMIVDELHEDGFALPGTSPAELEVLMALLSPSFSNLQPKMPIDSTNWKKSVAPMSSSGKYPVSSITVPSGAK